MRNKMRNTSERASILVFVQSWRRAQKSWRPGYSMSLQLREY
jgi:hypothetical protein